MLHHIVAEEKCIAEVATRSFTVGVRLYYLVRKGIWPISHMQISTITPSITFVIITIKYCSIPQIKAIGKPINIIIFQASMTWGNHGRFKHGETGICTRCVRSTAAARVSSVEERMQGGKGRLLGLSGKPVGGTESPPRG